MEGVCTPSACTSWGLAVYLQRATPDVQVVDAPISRTAKRLLVARVNTARIISGVTCASKLCYYPNAPISPGELSKLVHRSLEAGTGSR